MERPIRGPDKDGPFLDSEEAGKWIGPGIGEKAFESLMAKYLPTIPGIKAGKRKLWSWWDVAVLAYVIARGTAETEVSGE